MLNLLGVVQPWLPRLPLGRSRQAGLDIVGHILFKYLLTQPTRATYRTVTASPRPTSTSQAHGRTTLSTTC